MDTLTTVRKKEILHINRKFKRNEENQWQNNYIGIKGRHIYIYIT